MTAIEIRVANPNDADVVEAYHDRCFLDTYASQLAAGEFAAPDRDGTREQLRGWFGPDSDLDTHVAIIDGVPIGHYTVMDHRLVHLFVEPIHQGKGLGRHLLAQAEAKIADAGHTEFELHTRVENLPAIAFYKKAGWTVTDRVIRTVEHGISYDEHIMVKKHSQRAVP